MFSSNHSKLIAACYPMYNPLIPLHELRPDQNNLGKLTFYCSGRPKKIPNVLVKLLERAESGGKNSAVKSKAGLAVTLEMTRELVDSCRTELGCFVEQALMICEIGLRKEDEVELLARAVALFRAVATFASGSMLALNAGFMNRYITCLGAVSYLAQTRAGAIETRRLALLGLEAACLSELLRSPTSDYDGQVQMVLPALLYNCSNVPIDELRQSDQPSPMALGSVKSRRAKDIPTSDSATLSQLAASALRSLHTLFALAHASQIPILISSVIEWIDNYCSGELWITLQEGDDNDLVSWLSGVMTTQWVEEAYRATVVQYWSSQILSYDATNSSSSEKATRLVSIVTRLLRSEVNMIGLSVGQILSHLTSVLVRRSAGGLDDDYQGEVIKAIGALARSRIDQANDIVVDLIAVVQTTRNGTGERKELTSAGKVRGTKILIRAIAEVLTKARLSEGRPVISSRETIKANGNGNGHRTTKRHRIEPETMRDSLWLLNDPSSTLRLDYGRVLLSYLAVELDSTLDCADFFAEFYAAAYQLAFTTSLGSTASSLARISSRRSTRSRRSSTNSTRSLISSSVATPLDYALLAELVRSALSKPSYDALVQGVPMLLKMERDADSIASSEEVAIDQVRERRKAVKEIVAGGLIIGTTWRCREVEKIGQEVMISLAPSILPDPMRHKNEFSTLVDREIAPLNSLAIIEALSASSEVQSASGKDAIELRSLFTAPYRPVSPDSKPIATILYRSTISQQSVTNLSILRGILPSSATARSSRATSLADLQNSLEGGRAGSSSQASLRSSGASSMTGDRRSRGMLAKDVLRGLNSRLSVVF